MNDLSKLPKWAQHEITRLRGDLARARRDALAATSENARGTNVAISVDGGLTMRGLRRALDRSRMTPGSTLGRRHRWTTSASRTFLSSVCS